jgi:hypothetical protein
MRRLALTLTLTLNFVSLFACGGPQTLRPNSASVGEQPPLLTPAAAPPVPAALVIAPAAARSAENSAPHCVAGDWSARSLAPLLGPGKTASPAQHDRPGSERVAFPVQCGDSPEPPGEPDGPQLELAPVVLDGVELRVVSATPAGSSGRGWAGNQCTVDVRLADGSGTTVRLGAAEMPPFTSVTTLVRSGSAVWLSVTFNGYTREFPKGGNRIIALDLCAGRIAWQSKDSLSNGGLLLLDDYLISPYGFTSEPRFVFVLDARSGNVVQKLPVIENICPSSSWAPNWHRGDRCDAPRQKVGAATNPRVEGGLFLVDTNTGSAAFSFK